MREAGRLLLDTNSFVPILQTGIFQLNVLQLVKCNVFFTVRRFLTTDFGLSGTFEPKKRKMRLNRIVVDNQAVAKWRFE